MEADLKKFLQDIGSFAVNEGHELYLVGGSVRDALMNTPTKDYDLILSSDAIAFIKRYITHNSDVKIIEAFEPFKTIKIALKDSDYDIEFASARTESYKEAAAFPKVELASIKEDLRRRDFTINALLESAMPDNFAEIVDYIDGKSDLEQKLIRVFHDNSFIDDPTRIYRAIRFMAKFDFEIEAHSMKLIEAAAKHPDMPKWLKKRKNRFKIELDYIKALEPEKAQKAVDLLTNLEILID